jgi:hypothetical protein
MTQEEEIKRERKRKIKYASSSIGRVAVSKTVGWGFESLLAWINRLQTPNAQRRTPNFERGEREWALDVERWMLDVPNFR